ncbi:MAG TPA: flagellar motor protein MotB [Micropepsaceae bacterium]|nr:flagellar motor protein MotB [Micropepsaceae bacterium]
MAADGSIVIKKVKKVAGGGHHGGAWKVAYADFVTAMMAFFLLMWLINTTSPEQKRGIADYFAPQSVSESTSGSGGILGGTALGEDGAKGEGTSAVVVEMAPTETAEPTDEVETDVASGGPPSEISEETIDEAIAERERQEFEQAEMALRQAMQDMPDIAELSKNIIIDMTPEGLRIQLVDQEGRPMFEAGSAEPLERTRRLLREIAKVILRLPNRLNISGHTDSASFVGPNGYSNWELSADRANASRRILMQAGVPGDRIFQVSGKAGSEPLYPDDPYASPNRRISIVLLREAPVLPPDHAP